MATNTIVQLGSNLAFNENNNPLDGFSLNEVWTSGATGFVTGGFFGLVMPPAAVTVERRP